MDNIFPILQLREMQQQLCEQQAMLYELCNKARTATVSAIKAEAEVARLQQQVVLLEQVGGMGLPHASCLMPHANERLRGNG